MRWSRICRRSRERSSAHAAGRTMTRHPLSIVGAWLVTVSAFVFSLRVRARFVQRAQQSLFRDCVLSHPSRVLRPRPAADPARDRARAAATGARTRTAPVAAHRFERPVHRRTLLIVAALTFVNVLIVSLAAYRGVEHMETTAFCGQTCHTVMSPSTWPTSTAAHARVACVECHVGSGAASFAKDKINGVPSWSPWTGHYRYVLFHPGRRSASRAPHLRASATGRRSSMATRSR